MASKQQKIDDLEDEIVLQQALLESLGDEADEPGSQRRAIKDTIASLESQLVTLVTNSSTTPADDTLSSRPSSSSHSSLDSDDAFTRNEHFKIPEKRKADTHTQDALSNKRAATAGSSASASFNNQAALKARQRYLQAEEAARRRYMNDRDLAAQLSQPAPSAPSTSMHVFGAPSSHRPNIPVAPPFRPQTRPPPTSVAAPHNDASHARVKHEKREMPGTFPQSSAPSFNPSSPVIDLTGDDGSVSAPSASRYSWLQPSDQGSTPARQHGLQQPDFSGLSYDRLLMMDKMNRARERMAQSTVRNNHMQNHGPSGPHAAHSSSTMPSSYAPVNIYQPIAKSQSWGHAKALGQGPSRQLSEVDGLGALLGSHRNLGDVSDPYDANPADPYAYDYDRLAGPHEPERTDAEVAEDIMKLVDNIKHDNDEAALRATEVELESMTVNLKAYQSLGLEWLQKQEDGTNKGSILADDMGLGKTIQAIALMATRRSQDPACRTTLIIAPVALLRQWQQEIKDKLKRGHHSMSVFIHHGTRKKKTYQELQRYDVVLTTFGTLAVEQKRYERYIMRKENDRQAQMTADEKGLLTHENARWYRVIIDEAQNIKNRLAKSSKGAYRLKAKFRLCMTGTPMMNSVDELFSLLHFLRIPPYNDWKRFQLEFTKPMKGKISDFRQNAMTKLQAVLKATLLRRHKKSQFNGKPIIVLPERIVEESHPEYSPEERDFYNSIETQSRTQFNKYVEAGTVGRSYAHILLMLLRLRQACCHPHLIKDFGVAAAADITQETVLELAGTLSEAVIGRIKERQGAFECPVCFDATPNPAIFVPCGHDTCGECFSKIAEAANAEDGTRDAKCPNCRAAVNTKSVIDFEAFKKVHEVAIDANDGSTVDPAEAETQSEAEASDSDSDEDESDADDDDSIHDFVVDDDASTESEREEPALPDNKISDIDDDEPAPSRKASTKGKGKAKAVDVQAWASSAGKSKKGRKRRTKGKGESRGDKGEKKHAPKQTLAELKKNASKNKAAKKKYLRRIRQDWTSSAKVEKTLELLRDIIENTDEKVIVFSQWTSLLDLVEVPIDDNGPGWGYERYDGSMNANARADAVDNFKNDSKVRLMLVSLKAGNAGLNLNIASRVIILDPFWNPYVEDQAIDRAHRLGQMRDVIVQRLLIPDTVEDRILALQEKKRKMISEALDEGAAQRLGRLSTRELGYLFGTSRQP